MTPGSDIKHVHDLKERKKEDRGKLLHSLHESILDRAVLNVKLSTWSKLLLADLIKRRDYYCPPSIDQLVNDLIQETQPSPISQTDLYKKVFPYDA